MRFTRGLLALLLTTGSTLLTASCAAPSPDGRCAVTIDAGGPALVRAEDARGAAIALEGLLSRGVGLEQKHPANRWFVLPGRATLRMPRGKVTIEAFRGLHTALTRIEVDLTGRERAEVRVPLARIDGPEDQGWIAANTHLHLQKVSRADSDRYLREVPPADALEVLFVSHLERAGDDREYVTNGYAEADLAALSKATGVLFGNGEEHRHNFTPFGQGYGHVMFLNIKKLIQPVSIGPGIMKAGTDGRPLQRGIDEAKKDGATAIWCHNTFGLEDIPNWVTGRPHAQNIFDGGVEQHGSYRDTFYRYLNAGLRVPFSTGTDWFIYDFSRVYAFAPGFRTARDWLQALEEGKTYITNGPLLGFRAQDLGPGETVRLEQPGRIRVKGRARGRVDFKRIEAVWNGEVLRAAESRHDGSAFTAELSEDVEIPGPGWLALRIPPPPGKDEPAGDFPRTELGGLLFAHTSPVYVEVGGRKIRDEKALQGMLDEVRQARETSEKTGVFADDHERGHVLEVYATAVKVLERMLR